MQLLLSLNEASVNDVEVYCAAIVVIFFTVKNSTENK